MNESGRFVTPQPASELAVLCCGFAATQHRPLLLLRRAA